MLRLGLGLILAGLVAATQGAEVDEVFFAPRFNLSTTQLELSGVDFQPSYQISAGVVLVRPSDTARIGVGFDSTYRLPPVAQSQQESAPSLSQLQHLLHLEFKGEQVNVEFHPRKVSIGGERLKITFQPQSALIEGERLKILLQPHSATMLWNKAF